MQTRYEEQSDLIADLAEAEERIAQLEEALESRIVIEQAKGVLAERLAISVGEAFDILRYAARSHRIKLRDLAARVVDESQTPAPVVVAIARASRIRAASTRELSEAQRERKDQLETKLREQHERFREGCRAQ
jgi:cell division septum initiation protein DivIVA